MTCQEALQAAKDNPEHVGARPVGGRALWAKRYVYWRVDNDPYPCARGGNFYLSGAPVSGPTTLRISLVLEQWETVEIGESP